MTKNEGEPLDREQIWRDFHDAVNMSPSDLNEWLATNKSEASGWSDGDGETIGHHAGRRIVEIKKTRKSDLTDDDYRHMRKVVGYVHRHLAQGGPEHDKQHSAWRYSLMNWGHDPLAERQKQH